MQKCPGNNAENRDNRKKQHKQVHVEQKEAKKQ
jgi:hypothetical protein